MNASYTTVYWYSSLAITCMMVCN